jgi:hypothetical protein
MRGLGVTFSWNRRETYDISVTQNTLVSITDDWTPIDIFNPLDGSTFTIYNLAPAKFGLVDNVDRPATNRDLRSRNFTAYEFGFNARLGNASGFGAYTLDKPISISCDGTGSNPNTLRFCDGRLNPIKWRHEIKFAGSYTLPYDMQVNAAFQSYTGNLSGINWTLTRAVRYPAACPAPCPAGALVVPNLTVASLSVPLIAPGELYLPRHNQLDLGFRKLFRTRNVQWSGQVDIFNLNNSSRINNWTTAFGPSLFRPSAILQPRTLRLAAQLRF